MPRHISSCLLSNAVGIDFINDPLIAVFPRSNNNRDDLSTPVIIYDDDIDEVDEVFAVRLEVVHAQNMDRVNIISRNASLCRIVDNDSKLKVFIKYASRCTFQLYNII